MIEDVFYRRLLCALAPGAVPTSSRRYTLTLVRKARPPGRKRQNSSRGGIEAEYRFDMHAALDRVLQAARHLGASDVHLKAGLPPIFRIKGDLRTVRDVPPLSREVVQRVRLLDDVRPPARPLRADLGRRPGLLHPGRRPLPGQRVPAARKRGHGAAAHPARRAPLREAEPAPAGAAAGRRGAGADPGHRHHRLGQVDHPGGDGRLHQRQPGLPHRHHRGPGGVRLPGPEERHQPARGGLRYHLLRQGPARGPAAGPRRGPGGRDARPRDHRHRHDRRRDRPPGAVHPAHGRRLRDHQPHHLAVPAAPADAGPPAADHRAQGGHLAAPAAPGRRPGDGAGHRDPGRHRPGQGADRRSQAHPRDPRRHRQRARSLRHDQLRPEPDRAGAARSWSPTPRPRPPPPTPPTSPCTSGASARADRWRTWARPRRRPGGGRPPAPARRPAMQIDRFKE